jgi:hypothetical protein
MSRWSPLTMQERFWSKVDVKGPDECWEWTGSRPHGYGKMWSGEYSDNGHPRAVSAHRVSYVIHVGAIPDGFVIDHLCRNPGCVNPAHLEAVTHRENTLRGVGATAVLARRNACINGHPYENGERPSKCPKCHDANYWREYRAKRRAEGRIVGRRRRDCGEGLEEQ